MRNWMDDGGRIKFSRLFLAGLFAVVQSAASQGFFRLPEGEDPKHLVPLVVSRDLEYEALLNDKLLSRYGSGQLGTMLAMPPFTGEYCVSIYEVSGENEGLAGSANEKADRFVATAAIAARSLCGWLQEKKRGGEVPNVEVTHHMRPVSRELAVAFQRVWSQSILLARYPTAAPHQTSDGIIYRFSVLLDVGDICGEARNPESDLVREMADIGYELYRLVADSKPVANEEETNLVKRLKKLEERLNRQEK